MAYNKEDQNKAFQASIASYYQNTEGVQDAIDNLSVKVDTVAETTADVEKKTEQAKQRASRNRSRYNVNLTAAERNEMAKMNQRTGQATMSGAANLARRTDQDLNLFRLQALDNIRAGLTDVAQSGLGGLSSLATSRYNQYEQMRGKAKQQKSGFFGKIAGMAGSLLGSI
tara:strand:+ start:3817 stop:4326 length:510 start_codon:yes stop_codon:yes gene_type:complete